MASARDMLRAKCWRHRDLADGLLAGVGAPEDDLAAPVQHARLRQQRGQGRARPAGGADEAGTKGKPWLPEHSRVKTTSCRGRARRSARVRVRGRATRPPTSRRQAWRVDGRLAVVGDGEEPVGRASGRSPSCLPAQQAARPRSGPGWAAAGRPRGAPPRPAGRGRPAPGLRQPGEPLQRQRGRPRPRSPAPAAPGGQSRVSMMGSAPFLRVLGRARRPRERMAGAPGRVPGRPALVPVPAAPAPRRPCCRWGTARRAASLRRRRRPGTMQRPRNRARSRHAVPHCVCRGAMLARRGVARGPGPLSVREAEGTRRWRWRRRWSVRRTRRAATVGQRWATGRRRASASGRRAGRRAVRGPAAPPPPGGGADPGGAGRAGRAVRPRGAGPRARGSHRPPPGDGAPAGPGRWAWPRTRPSPSPPPCPAPAAAAPGARRRPGRAPPPLPRPLTRASWAGSGSWPRCGSASATRGCAC